MYSFTWPFCLMLAALTPGNLLVAGYDQTSTPLPVCTMPLRKIKFQQQCYGVRTTPFPEYNVIRGWGFAGWTMLATIRI
jgi:hypothetical protein